MDEWSKLRPEIEKLARDPRNRFSAYSPSLPCDWAPGTILNPESDMPFTEVGAWNLICDLLAGSHPFVEVKLRVPPGCKAYETTCRLRADLPPIYIKVQLYKGKVYCRSFHTDLRNK